MSNIAKSFDILAIKLSVLHNHTPLTYFLYVQKSIAYDGKSSS